MKKYLGLLVLFITLTATAQENVKKAFLEKWKNSENYLIAMAEAMPEEHYNFKPTERQRTFIEQLAHIKRNMDWLSNSYFDGPKLDKSKAKTKAEIIKELKGSFKNTYSVIVKANVESFNDTVDFFAGPKTKLQILNLLQDHVTHHRGQIIVYLNLKDVKPPRFVGW